MEIIGIIGKILSKWKILKVTFFLFDVFFSIPTIKNVKKYPY